MKDPRKISLSLVVQKEEPMKMQWRIQFMLNEETQDFDYLCSAIGTGGTISGISKFAERTSKVLGFKAW